MSSTGQALALFREKVRLLNALTDDDLSDSFFRAPLGFLAFTPRLVRIAIAFVQVALGAGLDHA